MDIKTRAIVSLSIVYTYYITLNDTDKYSHLSNSHFEIFKQKLSYRKEIKMTNINELYKCDICNNVVEIVHEGADALVCCSEAMQLQEENVPQKENLHFAHIEENGL